MTLRAKEGQGRQQSGNACTGHGHESCSLSSTDMWALGLSSALPAAESWEVGLAQAEGEFEGTTLLSSRKLDRNAPVCRVCGDGFV